MWGIDKIEEHGHIASTGHTERKDHDEGTNIGISIQEQEIKQQLEKVV